MGEFLSFISQNLGDFWAYTGMANATWQHFAMIAIGILFIYLAVAKEFEPMLLIPIGFGILGRAKGKLAHMCNGCNKAL